VTGNQKRILKKIGKFTAYTAMTGGAYFLARGAISLLLKKLEAKVETEPKAPREISEPAAKQSPGEMEKSKTPFVTP
jgi:hypothetical protein